MTLLIMIVTNVKVIGKAKLISRVLNFQASDTSLVYFLSDVKAVAQKRHENRARVEISVCDMLTDTVVSSCCR